MKNIIFYFFCIVNFYMISCNNHIAKTGTLAQTALQELRTVLNEQPQFIKVHAAEYLIWLGHNEEVEEVFLIEDSLHGNESPYRIGIWRVLAQAEKNQDRKCCWVNKIYEVFGDLRAPDRLHATEALAKLKQSPLKKYPELTQQALNAANRNLNVYALWAVSFSSAAEQEKNKIEFLRLATEDTDAVVRKISAYVLRKMGTLSVTQWAFLADKALAESATSENMLSLLNTAFATVPMEAEKTELYKNITAEIIKDNKHFKASERIELALALADKGGKQDLPLLTEWLRNEYSKIYYEQDSKEAADVRAASAYAILKIKNRKN